jgi:putative hydrolase of the HAD superfamily
MEDQIKRDTKIHNIIFDFGGVILNISHQNLENAFKDLGIINFDFLFNQAVQNELFQKFEKGEIQPAEFRNEVRKMTGLKVQDDMLDHAWNQIIGDYPFHRIELLKQISPYYRLFLFSNTNLIHYNFYIQKFRREFGYEFSTLFNNTFWSFRMGQRKPDEDSFLTILNQERLIPAETLFIDDSVQNILTAEKLGIIAFHLKNGMDVSDLFKDSRLLDDQLQLNIRGIH